MIFTSPLRRATETADIIADVCRVESIVVEGLREVNVGSLERMAPSNRAWRIHDSIVSAWFNGNPLANFPNGEDYNSLLNRFRLSLMRVCMEVGGSTAVVVGQGGLFGYTLRDICIGAPRTLNDQTTIQNCSITSISHNAKGDGMFRLHSWANTSHLDGENSYEQAGNDTY
jgi:broad specificity phosphatase PhoE